MKVAVVGSRDFNDKAALEAALQKLHITEIISGGATGADTLVQDYAREHNIPILVITPNWSQGKHAGLMRNTQIVEACDMLVAFWDGKSKGTADSIKKALGMKKPAEVVRFARGSDLGEIS